MNRKAELHDKIARANAELTRITTAENIASNSALVGKCYKYRNCYSSPQSEKDYWWMYSLVLGLNDRGMPEAFVFQKDTYGRITIEPKASFLMSEQQVEIPSGKLTEAWFQMLNEVEDVWAVKRIAMPAQEEQKEDDDLLFLEYKGWKIYHTQNSNHPEVLSDVWFEARSKDKSGLFDVQNLAGWSRGIEAAIKRAINGGKLESVLGKD